ncbi:MAG: lipocalin family protein [Crocinitomicaceae bacterium]|nr:lipocalin family protein [Crocinitomicaceae bacterium]
MKNLSFYSLLALSVSLFFSSCSKVSNSKIKGEWTITSLDAKLLNSYASDPSMNSEIRQYYDGTTFTVTMTEYGSTQILDQFEVSSYKYDFQKNDIMYASISYLQDQGGIIVPVNENAPGTWQSLEDHKLRISISGGTSIDYDIVEISSKKMVLHAEKIQMSSGVTITETYDLVLVK